MAAAEWKDIEEANDCERLAYKSENVDSCAEAKALHVLWTKGLTCISDMNIVEAVQPQKLFYPLFQSQLSTASLRFNVRGANHKDSQTYSLMQA